MGQEAHQVARGPNRVGGGPLQFQQQHLFIPHPTRASRHAFDGRVDRLGARHRAGYARLYNRWIESKGIQPDDPTVTKPHEIEERHKRRKNLVFMSQSGYNYDRKRNENEGTDWIDTWPRRI